jgi:putative oxidoreductase
MQACRLCNTVGDKTDGHLCHPTSKVDHTTREATSSFPDAMGPFVGVVEAVCGFLIILGLFTRLAAIPLIIIMIVALISTKLPILLGHDVWMFHLAQDIRRTGSWSMMHEARADLTMLLGSIYLLIVGAGRWSLDAVLSRS